MRWLRPAALVAVLTALAVLSVVGANRLSGDVVLVLTPEHGLHRSDIVVAALWLVGVALSLPWRTGAVAHDAPRRIGDEGRGPGREPAQ